MRRSLQKVFSIDKRGAALIFAGTIVWSLTMIKSGIRYSNGIGFWGPNGHDGIWHISLARSLAKGTLEMPIFAGEMVKNYHLGFDFLLALINRISTIPISVLYFQILPPLMALFIGILSYSFVFRWKKSRLAAFWSTFFVYFAGNLGWMVSFARTGDIGGESMFWAQPAILTLINPPFALSLLLILVALNLVISKNNSISTKQIITSSLLFGLLIQVKAYAGVIVISSLFAASMYEITKRKTFAFIKIFLLSSAISVFVFLPNLSSGSLLIFKPFWFLETMMIFEDRLGWTRFGEAMVNYKTGSQIIKAVLAYGVSMAIIWYGNVSTRIVGEFYWADFIRNKKKLSDTDVFVLSATIIGFLCSMLFVQRGTAWNTIQFFYYSLFFISIIAGIVFAGVIQKTKKSEVRNILIIGMIVFTLPTSLGTLKHYLPSRPPAMIGNNELQALEFLSVQPEGTVLIMPFDKDAAQRAVENPPRPLHLYESTAYVSAYSGQQVWLEDEVNLDITGYDWQQRRSRLQSILKSNEPKALAAFMSEENIKYAYSIGAKPIFSELKIIYQNDDVNLYSLP